MAKAGYINLFQGIHINITILAYGAGVDYCLFLTARYKEEHDAGASYSKSIERAIGSVGAALTASAATVMCGIRPTHVWFPSRLLDVPLNFDK